MNEEQKKDVTLRVRDLLESLDGLDQASVDAVNQANSQVVGLRDTNKFNLSVEMLSRDDVKSMRRQLVSAISAEKFTDGFVTAMQLVMMFGGV